MHRQAELEACSIVVVGAYFPAVESHDLVCDGEPYAAVAPLTFDKGCEDRLQKLFGDAMSVVANQVEQAPLFVLAQVGDMYLGVLAVIVLDGVANEVNEQSRASGARTRAH